MCLSRFLLNKTRGSRDCSRLLHSSRYFFSTKILLGPGRYLVIVYSPGLDPPPRRFASLFIPRFPIRNDFKQQGWISPDKCGLVLIPLADCLLTWQIRLRKDSKKALEDTTRIGSSDLESEHQGYLNQPFSYQTITPIAVAMLAPKK